MEKVVCPTCKKEFMTESELEAHLAFRQCKGEPMENGTFSGVGPENYQGQDHKIEAINIDGQAVSIIGDKCGLCNGTGKLAHDLLSSTTDCPCCKGSGLKLVMNAYIPEQDRERIEQAHMAGQRNAGIDPSYSSARAYYDSLSK